MELRPYQKEAVEASYNYFFETKGNPVISVAVGGGKTVIAAALLKRLFGYKPDLRAMVIQHRKELASHHIAKLSAIIGPEKIGVYCNKLNAKETHGQVTVASIQSIFRKPHIFGLQNLLIIDECHMINQNETGMYRKFIEAMFQVNPRLRILGMTGTAFRMDTGTIIDPGGLFNDIVYEIGIRELIQQQYLVPLVSKAALKQVDTTGVKVRGGDYVQSELEALMNTLSITEAALDEVEKFCHDRRSLLFFCSGIDHAEKVAAALRKRGITAETVLGNTPGLFRDQHLADFQSGKLRALVSVEVLTTGTDLPCIDAIILLRPTKSPGLFIQMIGRGVRLSPETLKRDCLVLDFTHTTEDLGPVDTIRVTRRRNPKTGELEGKLEKVATKVCPHCREICIAQAQECSNCAYEFPRIVKAHEVHASDAPVLAAPRRIEVENIDYKLHKKVGKPESMRVNYFTTGALEMISEWVCLEHEGFAARKAIAWWEARAFEKGDPPAVTEEALKRAASDLRVPSHITVIQEGKYSRIIGVEFHERKPSAADKFFAETGVNI